MQKTGEGIDAVVAVETRERRHGAAGRDLERGAVIVSSAQHSIAVKISVARQGDARVRQRTIRAGERSEREQRTGSRDAEECAGIAHAASRGGAVKICATLLQRTVRRCAIRAGERPQRGQRDAGHGHRDEHQGGV